MAKYRVRVKYGNPGGDKNNSTTVNVEAGSESTAMQLAINKFKNSNSIYKNKEVDVVEIKEI
ncbi:hypothetical protein TI05_17065 [Achromatium sp. WMS3]|nr:hypothetical protein TI05_17065 [Achromatium sp. WMS3]